MLSEERNNRIRSLAADDDGFAGASPFESVDVAPCHEAVFDDKDNRCHHCEEEEDGAAWHCEAEEDGSDTKHEHEPEAGADNLLDGLDDCFVHWVRIKSLHLQEERAERHQDGQHPVEFVKSGNFPEVLQLEETDSPQVVAEPEQDAEQEGIDELVELDVKFFLP